jgi:hypothetical protein
MRRYVALAAAILFVLAIGNANADTSDAGNSVFRVIAEDDLGADGVGTFTVLTGPDHPAGGGHEVLFSGASHADAASSYLTVRSYTTGTDYVQTASAAASGNLVSGLDSYSTLEPIADRGFRTRYELPATGSAPDELTIVSEVEVTGEGLGSAVELRTSLTNEGQTPLALGVRYLLDFAPASDDGPALRTGDLPVHLEEALVAAPGDRLRVAPTVPGAPAVGTAVTAAASDRGVFASWKHAFPFAFDFTPAGRAVAGPCGLNDSALLVYFGSSVASAITLAAGESTTLVMALSADDTSGFPADDASECATPAPTATPPPGEPLPVPQPVELPRTGGSLTFGPARYRQSPGASR